MVNSASSDPRNRILPLREMAEDTRPSVYDHVNPDSHTDWNSIAGNCSEFCRSICSTISDIHYIESRSNTQESQNETVNNRRKKSKTISGVAPVFKKLILSPNFALALCFTFVTFGFRVFIME